MAASYERGSLATGVSLALILAAVIEFVVYGSNGDLSAALVGLLLLVFLLFFGGYAMGYWVGVEEQSKATLCYDCQRAHLRDEHR